MTLAEQRKRLVKATQFVSGGLLNDVDVEVTDAKFVWFNYEGKGPEVCASQLTLKDTDGEEHEQHWPVGGYNNSTGESQFAPSEDGKFIYATTDKKNLNRGSNHSLMVDSLKRAGLSDESNLDDDISILIGLKGHVLRMPAPKRNMPNQKSREDGREPEVLVWSDVTAFPWEKGGKGAGKGKAAGSSKASKATPADDDGDDAETKAELAVRKAVAEAGDEGLNLGEVTVEVMQALAVEGMSKADRKPIMALIDAAFVAGLDGVEEADGTYTLA